MLLLSSITYTLDEEQSQHVYLNIELLASRQVCKLGRVVIDVGDQDVNGGGGIQTRVALVSHQHPQTVLAVLLPVQCHPVDDFTWTDTEKRPEGEN